MRSRIAVAGTLLLLAGCALFRGGPEGAPPPPPPPASSTTTEPRPPSPLPSASASPSPRAVETPAPSDALPVRHSEEVARVMVSVEPRRLPAGGGDTQVLVKVVKRGGVPLAGVEVRLQSSSGTLFSAGKVLVTDGSGRTRDRLTTHRSATVTVNAGGRVEHATVTVPE